ncbi:hypothetical protein [Limnofasciculus baicalensis]|nr:hypothetical protein [Limnofasciculus baicalensis]
MEIPYLSGAVGNLRIQERDRVALLLRDRALNGTIDIYISK